METFDNAMVEVFEKTRMVPYKSHTIEEYSSNYPCSGYSVTNHRIHTLVRIDEYGNEHVRRVVLVDDKDAEVPLYDLLLDKDHMSLSEHNRMMREMHDKEIATRLNYVKNLVSVIRRHKPSLWKRAFCWDKIIDGLVKPMEDVVKQYEDETWKKE